MTMTMVSPLKHVHMKSEKGDKGATYTELVYALQGMQMESIWRTNQPMKLAQVRFIRLVDTVHALEDAPKPQAMLFVR